MPRAPLTSPGELHAASASASPSASTLVPCPAVELRLPPAPVVAQVGPPPLTSLRPWMSKDAVLSESALADAGAQLIELSGPDAAPEARVTGEVVWDGVHQLGFLHIRRAPANDPAKAQYQVWIYDPGQDASTPIDGGVFDVGASGEVTFPITPKLAVSRPTRFEVTLEKPGGVVVSKRKRLLVAGDVRH